jgi:glycosyltransferase involved in cell wall biosynthesis
VDDGSEGSLLEQARAADVKVVVVPSLVRPIRPVTDLRALYVLVRLFRAEKFDIVHTHSSKAGILGRVAARLARVPLVVHTLHSLVFHEYQSRWTNAAYIQLKKLCAPLADVIIAVNDLTAKGALAAGIGRPGQYVTIFSGIELDQFLGIAEQLPAADAKARLGIDPGAPVVGKIARMFPLKGHEQFFEAAARIAGRNPAVRFLLVGDGPLRPDLEARARALGLADRTVFTGRVPPDQVPACIQAMDVVVHTSLREGIARVLPQAGAVGKPVVTFALDGAPEVVFEGVSGHLVPPLDTGQLAERTLELLGDPGRRAAYGEAARRFAAANFGIDQMIERIDRVYERLLSARPVKADADIRSELPEENRGPTP